MKKPQKPKMSLNSVVQSICNFTIELTDLNTKYVVPSEIEDIVRSRLSGFLVVITCEKPSVYKVFCFNSWRLHCCPMSDSLYEIDGNSAWSHSLDTICYYMFIPHDSWAELDALKRDVCSHLTSKLLENENAEHTRFAFYFHEFRVLD